MKLSATHTKVSATNLNVSRKTLMALSFMAVTAGANATPYDAGVVSFSTSSQSMWGEGSAIRHSDSVFVGTEWSDKTATVGDSYFGNSVEVSVQSSGQVGLEFGYTVDSGSVDASMDYTIAADVPTAPIQSGSAVNLNTSSLLGNTAFASQSPTIEAYVNAIVDLTASISTDACLVGVCGSGSIDIPDIAINQHLISVDPNGARVLNGLGGVAEDTPLIERALLGQELTVSAELDATLAPGVKVVTSDDIVLIDTTHAIAPGAPNIASVEVGTIAVNVPEIQTVGEQEGDTIVAGGRDDLLSIKADLDGLAALTPAVPIGAMSVSSNIDTPVGQVSVSMDVIDVDAGPDIGVFQEFELTPTLMAQLDFSEAVEIDGLDGFHTSWEGAWDELPELTVFNTTVVDPLFYLDANLEHVLGFDFSLSGTMDLFKGSIEGFGLDFGFSLNDILGTGNELFSTDELELSVWDEMFSLGGFDAQRGSAFTLFVDSASIEVPEPSTLALLMVGFLSLVGVRKRLSTNAEA